jgi:nucleoside-diphosphate-sugar epimerase
MTKYPEKIADEQHLEELLSIPSVETIEMFSRIDGDIIFLGIAGKIGPSLAWMAKKACEKAGVKKRIIGVSRFRSEEERKKVESYGIEIIRGDLLDQSFLESLPKVKNVFFLAGMKFGSNGNFPFTWAMNSFLPGLVAKTFKDSRIVAYSTSCVYPLTTIGSGGAKESDTPVPIGEYALSCLGRERMFEYGSNTNNTPVAIIRLSYAVEMRYGVLVDIATQVKNRQVIDLSMGYSNVIWQGDSNDVVLRSLEHASSPAKIINISGEEEISVRSVAEEFGKLFGIEPKFAGTEAATALLINSKSTYKLFGKPKVSVSKLISWIADWLNEDRRLLGKPTHFEVRDGKY